jgi:hypothetical protein
MEEDLMPIPFYHVAGPVVDGVQKCTRCSATLYDASYLGKPAAPYTFEYGTPEYVVARLTDAFSLQPAEGWAEGASIAITGNYGLPDGRTVLDVRIPREVSPSGWECNKTYSYGATGVKGVS